MKITIANSVQLASVIAGPSKKHADLYFANRDSIVKSGIANREAAVQELSQSSGASIEDCCVAIDFLCVLEFISSLASVWNDADETLTDSVTFSHFVQSAAKKRDVNMLSHEAHMLIEKFYSDCLYEMHRSITYSIAT